jgi:phosphatidylserine/phosphatidylglycerophosphate/cardiolipin synthase-like enzyme
MNNLGSAALSEKIAQIVSSTPPELIEAVLPKLATWVGTNGALSRAETLANVVNTQVRSEFGALFDLWQECNPDLPGSALALALQSTLTLHIRDQQMQVDLTWTGPETQSIPMRRTDQAIIQLIDVATTKLLIVSFAVYKIECISDALKSAIRRGVQLKIVLENPEESGGKICFAGASAFGRQVLQNAELYTWPLENRPKSDDGKHGSLHAKLALADEQVLFISSANLTDYAMNLNMEMGVLIHGSDLPRKVGRHFEELIEQRILMKSIN